MPLTRIDMCRGKSAEFKKALMDGIYEAMRETFDVPEDDRFMTIVEHDDTTFSFGRTYLGIVRSDDLVIVQITANNTRTVERRRPSTPALRGDWPIPLAFGRRTYW